MKLDAEWLHQKMLELAEAVEAVRKATGSICSPSIQGAVQKLQVGELVSGYQEAIHNIRQEGREESREKTVKLGDLAMEPVWKQLFGLSPRLQAQGFFLLRRLRRHMDDLDQIDRDLAALVSLREALQVPSVCHDPDLVMWVEEMKETLEVERERHLQAIRDLLPSETGQSPVTYLLKHMAQTQDVGRWVEVR